MDNQQKNESNSLNSNPIRTFGSDDKTLPPIDDSQNGSPIAATADSIGVTSAPLPMMGKSLSEIQDEMKSKSVNQAPEIPQAPVIPQPASALPALPDAEQLKKLIRENTKNENSGGRMNIPNPFDIFYYIKMTIYWLLFLILISIVVLVITVIFRPSITWEPLKAILNAGYKPPVVTETTSSETEDFIDAIISGSGAIVGVEANTIVLTESQITALLRGKLGENKNQIVDIEEDRMRVVFNGDSKNERPLWFVLEMSEVEDNQLTLSKIGFVRFGIPGFLRDNLGGFIFRAMSLAQGKFGEQTNSGMLDFLIGKELENPININDVRFEKDRVVISYSKK